MSVNAPLLCHPDSRGAPLSEIDVDVARRVSVLTLTYTVRGDIGRVRVPETCVSARADGLWQRTCFEAFVRGLQSASYWEFNLSPSLLWAAYRFDKYRQGMAAESAVADPSIKVQWNDSELRLSATLDRSGISALAACEHWRAGLSAIIEDKSGDKSYWALAHPPGKPDFHHAESFALCLTP